LQVNLGESGLRIFPRGDLHLTRGGDLHERKDKKDELTGEENTQQFKCKGEDVPVSMRERGDEGTIVNLFQGLNRFDLRGKTGTVPPKIKKREF